jgi:hypothetical protein
MIKVNSFFAPNRHLRLWRIGFFHFHPGNEKGKILIILLKVRLQFGGLILSKDLDKIRIHSTLF